MAQKLLQYLPEKQPKLPLKKDACINFRFWLLQVTCLDAFYYCSSVPNLIGQKLTKKQPEIQPEKWPEKCPESIELPPRLGGGLATIPEARELSASVAEGGRAAAAGYFSLPRPASAMAARPRNLSQAPPPLPRSASFMQGWTTRF